VVVAVIAVRVMQVPIHKVVDMVAMRDGLMPAPGPVHVTGLMPCAAVLGRAPVGIARRHFDRVLVDMVPMRMVQVPIVQVVDVIAVANGRMPAISSVLVRMSGMFWS
jgi:hypothetical protein